MSTQTHIGELALRRYRVGELPPEERQQAMAHAEACAHCRSRLRALEDEQRRFEQDISFERFAAGVTRATRTPHASQTPRAPWLYPAMGLAALVTMAVLAGPLIDAFEDPRTAGLNRTKGAAAKIDVRIAAGEDGPQRTAAEEAAEPLGPGERVRIGYETSAFAYVAVVSVDAQGVVSPLYPERGESLPVAGSNAGMTYLPGSLEFTGEGAEKVYVVFSDEPLPMELIGHAAERAFEESGRDVTKMTGLDVPGEVFHRTLLKP